MTQIFIVRQLLESETSTEKDFCSRYAKSDSIASCCPGFAGTTGGPAVNYYRTVTDPQEIKDIPYWRVTFPRDRKIQSKGILDADDGLIVRITPEAARDFLLTGVISSAPNCLICQQEGRT